MALHRRLTPLVRSVRSLPTATLGPAWLGLVLLTAAGCWPHGKYVRTIPLPGQVTAARPPANVPVHDADKAPVGAYEVIAGVQAVSWSRSWTPLAGEEELRQMTAQASSKIGADAVIGFTWRKDWCGKFTHPSAARCTRAMGLAARIAKAGAGGARKRLPFALTVLPMKTGERDPVAAERISEEVGRQLRYIAEEKGYYVLPGRKASPPDPEDLPRLDGDALDDLGDRAAELVLALEITAREALTAGLVVHDRWALEASLFSKSSRAWVWKKEHLYDKTRGGGEKALLNAAGAVEFSLLDAVGEALEDLPPPAYTATEVP